MTIQSIRNLGLTTKQAYHIFKILDRSQVSAVKRMGKDNQGRWRDIKQYDSSDAMRVIRGRLDYDCMELVRLYDASR